MKEMPSTNTDHPTSSDVPQTPPTGFKSLLACWTKLNNDWVLSFASGLAFNLIVALIPISIAMISLAGFIYGRLDPTIQADLITSIQHAFPEPIPSEEIVSLALDTLNKNAGLLGIIAIVGAVIGGSGLFVSMEGYFDIIYRTHTRGLIQQYVMAVGMILLFVLLTPFMIFADTVPALVHSVLQGTPISHAPGFGISFDLGGIIAGSAFCWVLIEVMYLVVPNWRIRFRKSWFGALVAAVAVQAYLLLFPFYVTHFLSGYSGTIGFAIIFLFFFYYYALILLVGAEINAFFGEGIPSTTDNLSGIVRDHSGQPPATEEEKL